MPYVTDRSCCKAAAAAARDAVAREPGRGCLRVRLDLGCGGPAGLADPCPVRAGIGAVGGCPLAAVGHVAVAQASPGCALRRPRCQAPLAVAVPVDTFDGSSGSGMAYRLRSGGDPPGCCGVAGCL